MSYSCADFVNDCDNNADTYGVPEASHEDLEDCVSDETLRILAERVARAMSQLLRSTLSYQSR
jgi:hypothetical protein